MKVVINDHETICPDQSTLKEILIAGGVSLQNIAVAIDTTVIPKAQWDTTRVEDGSSIIIIKAVQGG